MTMEIEMLKQMNTWTVTSLPRDRKPITCRWVFALKHDATGAIIKYKARLVARGFSQEYRIDYKETFAPVIRLDALRAMLALSAIHGWHVRQLDIKGAYLHGDLEEEIYMIQPPEFNDGTDKVCKLIHSLYGLKQSGRAWYHKFRSILLKYGFEQLSVEHCLYIRVRNGKPQIISSWIDDLLLFGDDPEATAELVAILGKEFEIHDLGEPRYLIGMEIHHDYQSGTITLSQKQYIKKILEKHRMQDSKPVSTPINPNVVLLKRT